MNEEVKYLRVVCQLCGKTETLDTNKPQGSEPHGEHYHLIDFGIPDNNPYANYEIWICEQCHEEVIDHWDCEKDPDSGVYHQVPEYDFEQLTERVLKSLKSPPPGSERGMKLSSRQRKIYAERERTLQFLKEVAGDRQATIIFELREFISVEQIRAGVSHAFFVTVEPQSRKDNPDWAWYYILIGENIAKQIKKDLASIGLERCRFKICSKGG